jgi:hypothetical protein
MTDRMATYLLWHFLWRIEIIGDDMSWKLGSRGRYCD